MLKPAEAPRWALSADEDLVYAAFDERRRVVLAVAVVLVRPTTAAVSREVKAETNAAGVVAETSAPISSAKPSARLNTPPPQTIRRFG